MPKFRATQDLYLSTEGYFVKKDQIVDFPEGKEPNGKDSGFVPVDAPIEAPLPLTSAMPVNASAARSDGLLTLTNEDYDGQMANIVAGEQARDSVLPLTQPLVNPNDGAPIVVPVVAPLPSTEAATADQQGTGNQDVL